MRKETYIHARVIAKIFMELANQGKITFTLEELKGIFEQLFAQAESSVEIKH